MDKQKLLIIGMVFPEPNSSAAGRRILQLIQLFKEAAYDITFASPAQGSEHEFNLGLLAIQKTKISLNDESFDTFVQNLKPDVVLFDRFVIEEQFGWRVSKYCSEAIKILDTEDLHFLRLARQDAFKKKKEFTISDLFSDTAKREIASILRCDISLIISDFEMKLLVDEFKIDSSVLFYLPIFADSDLDFVPLEERKDFVFIGNFLHEPNWDAVQYLKSTIWPLIHKQLPDAKMLIYGAYPSQKVLELNHPKSNFHIMGRAESAAEVIKKAKVMLAPLRFGAGIKGKLIEAMEYGTPSVTTSIGAEGMQKDGLWNGFIMDNPADFAHHAIELYKDENLWRNAQKNGVQLLENKFAENLYKESFIAMVLDLKGNLMMHRNKNFIGQILQYHTIRSTEYMSRWIEAKNKKIPS
ncbi:MAG: glycosyltransferase [Flavobacteriaceae bacterium]|nr:MAG: glycosyltransferase [Flavobacteriaceae bacterium]